MKVQFASLTLQNSLDMKLESHSFDWKQTLLRALLALFATAAGNAQAQDVCGPLKNAYGPYDYRISRGSTLDVVESHHFTPQVEALISGQEGYVGSDLDYTLRAFPNHHRALLSLIRFAEKLKLPKDPNMHWSFECYFERAIRFQRNDPIARMLYATYLGRQNRLPEAKQQLQAAAVAAAADDNPFTYYNIGMVYADLKDWDNALSQAHKAYKMGFNQPGLRDRLKAAGKWQEPK